MSVKDNTVGTVYVAGGGYLSYKGLEHGLPRALGIRTEYHTTSKENAKLIKKAGNILDPKFGGKNGWSAKIHCDSYIENSKNYIHITGTHPDSKISNEIVKTLNTKLPKKISNTLTNAIRTCQRKMQCIMYKTFGNSTNMEKMMLMSKKERLGVLWDAFKNSIFNNKTKRFCIPGIDSYFAKEFIADSDDIALKSAKPLKAYTNRFSAMIVGLKEFGLKGIKENKSRVMAGLSMMALATYGACKLIKKGIKQFKQNNQNNVANKLK